MIPNFLKKSQIPHQAGVYIFKNGENEVLYVGKAIDLYHRVSSYFNKGQNIKVSALVDKIAQVETIIVESELEALILEANLIKKFHPSFNVRLVDDKDYLYIGLTDDVFPQVITLRKQDLKKTKRFWGPFPSGKTVRSTLKLLRRVFPWCSAPNNRLRKRACFYYHLRLCPGVCTGEITQKDYHKIIHRFSKFMDGKVKQLIAELNAEMMELSKRQEFEQAEIIKKSISGIIYLTQPNRVKLYLENPNFLEDERKLALLQLQKDLKLTKIPQRIEGYDISNILGQQAVGSMVVLTNGEVDKSSYRKFKIKISGRANDVAMHREVIGRRLNHPEWPFPDLILIDGGRGQVRAVQQTILKHPAVSDEILQIPVLGLAKRMEWLYPPDGEIIKLPKNSLSLKLLQKLRDESHRFAVSYHRKLRDNIIK